MGHVLPIGSVVEAHNEKLFLLGSRLVTTEGKMTLAYVAVKYPLGYSGKESVGVVLAEDIKSVLFEGNAGETGKKYYAALEKMYEGAQGKTPEEAADILDKAALAYGYQKWTKR